jgi:hypothetical protein
MRPAVVDPLRPFGWYDCDRLFMTYSVEKLDFEAGDSAALVLM